MKRLVAFLVVLGLCLLSASGALAFTSWGKRIKDRNKATKAFIELPNGKVMEVSPSYAEGPYYRKIVDTINKAKTDANLTPVKYYLQIAESQLNYKGGTSKNKYAGNYSGSEGEHTEYTWDNIPWCASFVSWCAKAAGFSESVIPTGISAGNWRGRKGYEELWTSNYTKYNSSVDIRPGDLILFFGRDIPREEKDSNGKTKRDENGNKIYRTIDVYKKDGTKIAYKALPGKTCNHTILSPTGTVHVAIVWKSTPIDADGKPCKDTNKPVAGYSITTIERSGNTVLKETYVTNERQATACEHIYGKGQKVQRIRGRFRPNWSAAGKLWSGTAAEQKDTAAPVMTGICVSNINATGFDLNVKASDNVGVTGYRVDVYANYGQKQYDEILAVSTVSGNSTQTYHFNWSQFKAGMNFNYHIYVYPLDAAKNMGTPMDVWALADGSSPDNVTAYTTNVTKDGYDLVVHAKDPSGIASVRINIYGASIKRYDQWKDADSSTDFTGVYHFNFRTDYETFAGDTLYANYVYIKDGIGNTTDPIRADVFADASAPTVTAKGFEDENEEGFTARYVVKDNSEIAEINVEVYKDGEYQETYLESVYGSKTHEGSYRFTYPKEAEGEEHYTAKITVCDTAGNETEAIDFGTNVVRNEANTLPKDYFRDIEHWNYEIDGEHLYITGPANPEACASVTKLLPSDFPAEINVDGVVCRFWGTREAEDPSHSFAAMTSLREIVGFPETIQEIGGFEGCPALIKVNCTGYNIEPRAFANCPVLSEVILRDGTSSIGEDAFENCPGLTKLLYEDTPETWKNVVIAGEIPPVSCRVDLSSECQVDTTDRTLGVITATFTNKGWLGDATHWSNNVNGNISVYFYDEMGNWLGDYTTYEPGLSACGRTCTVHLDLEDMARSFELAPDTTYHYEVAIRCDGKPVSSQMDFFTTNSLNEDLNPIQYITLNYSGITLSKGDSFWLYRYLHPGDAKNREVSWTSSDPSVVSVANGELTANGAGTATITCEALDPLANGAKAICKVLVTEDCVSCSSQYAGWYKVSGTAEGLPISSKHIISTLPGASRLGMIPENTVIWISKAMGYSGIINGGDNYFGHACYQGINGFVNMDCLEKVNDQTVTLDLNGGTASDSFYKENGVPVLHVTLWKGGTTNNAVINRIPERTGYSFRGWNTNATGTGEMVYDAFGISEVDDNYWITGDSGPAWAGKPVSTLYAAWEPIQNTITFEPTGGMVEVVTQKMTYNSPINNTAPVPSKAGCSFEGWYATESMMVFDAAGNWNSGAISYFSSEGKWQQDRDVTVRAHWNTEDTTPPVIRDVYVYDRSADGYIVSFIAEDDVALDEVYIESWTTTEGETNAVKNFASMTGNRGLAWVNVSEHGGETDASYITRIIARDVMGNEDIRTLSNDKAVYLDAEPPVVHDVKIESIDEYGVILSADVSDNESLEYIRCLIWPQGEEQPDEPMWYSADRFFMDEGANWTACVSIPQSSDTLWNLAVRAEDGCFNISSEYHLTVDVGKTKPTEPLYYRAFDQHVYILMSPISRSLAGEDLETVWEGTDKLCQSMGGHLISIDSENERAFAASMADMYCDPVWIGEQNKAIQPDGTYISEAEKPEELFGFICEIDDDVLSLPQVKEIGERAFYRSAARVAVIPESCEIIGSEAFAQSDGLEYVILPTNESVSIDEYAFPNTVRFIIKEDNAE